MAHDDPADSDGGHDERAGDGDASARGIAQCLRMLLDEASSLRMPRTREALRRALDACDAEGAAADAAFDAATVTPPPGVPIH